MGDFFFARLKTDTENAICVRFRGLRGESKAKASAYFGTIATRDAVDRGGMDRERRGGVGSRGDAWDPGVGDGLEADRGALERAEVRDAFAVDG